MKRLIINNFPVLMGDIATYSTKAAKILPANLIGWWKMADASGTTCTDSSPYANNGTYTNITLGQTGFDGGMCALIDNTADGISVVSTVSGDFNGSAGGFSLWLKPGANAFDTSTTRRGFRFRVDASNQVNVYPFTNGSGTSFIEYDYVAGGTTKSVTYELTVKPTDWFNIGATWDKPNDAWKAFYQGSQVGVTQTSLGTWAGTLALAEIACGSGSGFLGWVQHGLLYNVAPTPAQMLALGTQTPG